MTIFNNVWVVVLMMVTAAHAFASGWTKSASVVDLTASTQQVFVVRLALEKNSCKSKDSFYLDYAAPGSELIFHSLLEALVNNQPVELYATGVCELNGYEGFSAVKILAN